MQNFNEHERNRKARISRQRTLCRLTKKEGYTAQSAARSDGAPSNLHAILATNLDSFHPARVSSATYLLDDWVRSFVPSISIQSGGDYLCCCRLPRCVFTRRGRLLSEDNSREAHAKQSVNLAPFLCFPAWICWFSTTLQNNDKQATDSTIVSPCCNSFEVT